MGTIPASLLALAFQSDVDPATMVRVVAGLLVVFVIPLYFLPSILGRNKANRGAIFALNLLLGWTFVGWVVALVWAVSRDAGPTQVIIHQTPTAAVLCGSCGKYSPAESRFCPTCGASFAGRSAAAIQPRAAN